MVADAKSESHFPPLKLRNVDFRGSKISIFGVFKGDAGLRGQHQYDIMLLQAILHLLTCFYPHIFRYSLRYGLLEVDPNPSAEKFFRKKKKNFNFFIFEKIFFLGPKKSKNENFFGSRIFKKNFCLEKFENFFFDL